jgi:hypothetical protein
MKQQNIYSKEWVNKNLILKLYYPSKVRTSKDKLNYILPNFRSFLNVYSTNLKKIYRKFPTLKLDSYQLEKRADNPNYFYLFIYTEPYNNHPFLLYGDVNNRHYMLYVPFGDKVGQIQTKTIENIIPYFDKEQLTATMILINRTIFIRHKNIVQNPKYSLFNCENISPCRKEMNIINKLKITKQKKRELIKDAELKYSRQAREMLEIFFKLLRNYQFEEASQFLKGGPKYFRKTRINTFFVNKKKIIGHLEVFIYLYKLDQIIRNKV